MKKKRNLLGSDFQLEKPSVLFKPHNNKYEILALKPISKMSPYIDPQKENETILEEEDIFDFRPRVFLKIQNSKIFIFKTFSFLEADKTLEQKQDQLEVLMNKKPLHKKRIVRPFILEKKKFEKYKINSQIIEYFQLGFKITEISCSLGLPQSTISDVLVHYQETKRVPDKLRGRESLITKEEIQETKRIFQSIPHHSIQIKDLIKKLGERLKLSFVLKTETMRKMIKLSGYSRKRSSKSGFDANSERIIEIRFKKVFILCKFLSIRAKFIFIDESSFNKGLETNYGYSLVNKAFVAKKIKRILSISILTAINQERIVGFLIVSESIKAKDFGSFLINLIKKNQDIKEDLKNYVFYCDNAAIHKANCLDKITHKINLFYGPPYSPELNPIEKSLENGRR